jgi:bacterioferritin
MQLFEALLADEEGHVGALETQIDLHRRIGAERYAQLNAAAIDSAE